MSYHATARLKWNLRARLLVGTHNRVCQVCTDNKGSKVCKIFQIFCRISTSEHMKEMSTSVICMYLAAEIMNAGAGAGVFGSVERSARQCQTTVG